MSVHLLQQYLSTLFGAQTNRAWLGLKFDSDKNKWLWYDGSEVSNFKCTVQLRYNFV